MPKIFFVRALTPHPAPVVSFPSSVFRCPPYQAVVGTCLRHVSNAFDHQCIPNMGAADMPKACPYHLPTENGKRKTENGKRKTENGKRKTENGKRNYLSIIIFEVILIMSPIIRRIVVIVIAGIMPVIPTAARIPRPARRYIIPAAIAVIPTTVIIIYVIARCAALPPSTKQPIKHKHIPHKTPESHSHTSSIVHPNSLTT